MTPKSDCKSGCSSGECCSDKLSKMIDLLSGKLNEHGLTEIKFENDALSLKVSKQISAVSSSVSVASAPSAPSSGNTGGHIEKSPMVGVVYFVPEPGAEPFISVGKTVKKGDTLCLVEAMKTFNAVKASQDGVVKDILVKSEAAVEYDTPLVVLG